MDSVVNNAYVGQRKISWMEIYAGEKSANVYGDDVWLLDETHWQQLKTMWFLSKGH